MSVVIVVSTGDPEEQNWTDKVAFLTIVTPFYI